MLRARSEQGKSGRGPVDAEGGGAVFRRESVIARRVRPALVQGHPRRGVNARRSSLGNHPRTSAAPLGALPTPRAPDGSPAGQ